LDGVACHAQLDEKEKECELKRAIRLTVVVVEEKAYHKLGGVSVDAVVVYLLVVTVAAHEEAAAAGRE
jgi:NADH:ubiquinone oxidoreductase subunit K